MSSVQLEYSEMTSRFDIDMIAITNTALGNQCTCGNIIPSQHPIEKRHSRWHSSLQDEASDILRFDKPFAFSFSLFALIPFSLESNY